MKKCVVGDIWFSFAILISATVDKKKTIQPVKENNICIILGFAGWWFNPTAVCQIVMCMRRSISQFEQKHN